MLLVFDDGDVQDTLALGVFDGHSGAEAAHFAQEKLLGHIKVPTPLLYIPYTISILFSAMIW